MQAGKFVTFVGDGGAKTPAHVIEDEGGDDKFTLVVYGRSQDGGVRVVTGVSHKPLGGDGGYGHTFH